MATYSLKELAERTRERLKQHHADWVADGGPERAKAEAEAYRRARVANGEETEDGESLIVVEEDEEDEEEDDEDEPS
jgi:hypothetical protein